MITWPNGLRDHPLRNQVMQQLSKKQKSLIRKHGTPKEFSIAVWGMVGEISVDEAQAAIIRYNAEFSKL